MNQEILQIKAQTIAKRYVELTKQGLSNHQICIELDISSPTLFKYLKLMNVSHTKKTKLDAFAIKKGDQIKELFAKGANLSEVQNHFKVSNATMQKVLKRLGIKYSKTQTFKFKASEAEIGKMIEMRKEGKTLQAIADVYGVTRERIRQRIASVQPEIVLQGLGPRTKKICVVCDTPMAHKTKNSTCSSHCKNVRNQKFIFTRDDALRIMKYRDEGKTWDEIGAQYAFKKPYLFRIYLERKINIILSSEERAKYIRAKAPNGQ